MNPYRDCPNVSPGEILRIISDSVGISRGTVGEISGGCVGDPFRISGKISMEHLRVIYVAIFLILGGLLEEVISCRTPGGVPDGTSGRIPEEIYEIIPGRSRKDCSGIPLLVSVMESTICM